VDQAFSRCSIEQSLGNSVGGLGGFRTRCRRHPLDGGSEGGALPSVDDVPMKRLPHAFLG